MFTVVSSYITTMVAAIWNEIIFNEILSCGFGERTGATVVYANFDV